MANTDNSTSGAPSEAGGASHVSLSRDLGLLDVTMIGVGAMIGAGIFVLTGIAAGAAGPALILSFALNGVITIFTAMVYAELGSAIPEAGGGYLWVKEGLPGPNGFVSGWMSWFAHAVAGSLYGLGFGAYLAMVFSELGVSFGGVGQVWVEKGFAVLIILTFIYVNYRGSSETGLAGNIVTIIKIAILLLFIGSGLWVVFRDPSHLSHFDDFAPEGFAGVLSAMGLTYVAFEGYEIIVQAGEETKDPRRTIPRAVFYSLAIVIPIYMLVAFVSIGAVDAGDLPTYTWLGQHKELGLVEAARQFMPLGSLLLLVGGLFSTMSALNATTYSSTRVSFAMGRDRHLPDAFGQIHEQKRTPYKALAFSGGLILFMALAIPIEDVASAADIMFLLLFLQVNVALFRIRNKYGKRLRYGYILPFFPAVPILGIVLQLFLAVFMFTYSAIAWYFVLGWIGIGLAIYYAYVRGRQEQEETSALVARQKRWTHTPAEGYCVLVPIANPNSLKVLVPPAVAAARREGGTLLLLHVVQVPRQLPLSAGRSYARRRQELIDKALAMVPDDVETEVVLRVAHDAARAIMEAVRTYGVDLLVMGWHGRSKDPKRLVGRHIDRIIQTVNSDVVVVQQNETPPFGRILVPVADAGEAAFALRTAAIVADDDGAHVDLLHVFPPDTTDDARERTREALHEAVDAFMDEEREKGRPSGIRVDVQEAEHSNRVRAIVDAGADYDCVILGTSPTRGFHRRFGDREPVRIARRLAAPVLLVRPEQNALRFGLTRVRAFFRGESASEEKGDLHEAGMLRPEGEEQELHTDVGKGPLLAVGIVAMAGCAALYLGHGGTVSWIGAAVFLAALMAFTWISKKGVDGG